MFAKKFVELTNKNAMEVYAVFRDNLTFLVNISEILHVTVEDKSKSLFIIYSNGKAYNLAFNSLEALYEQYHKLIATLPVINKEGE